ncbi:MAG: hypothetical protein LBR57_00365, partial [Alistipes sp.]|nr:hypothetical protein [Alistipes sp.]
SSVVFAPEPTKHSIPVAGDESSHSSNVALRLTAVEGMTKMPLDKVGDYEFLEQCKNPEKDGESDRLAPGWRAPGLVYVALSGRCFLWEA